MAGAKSAGDPFPSYLTPPEIAKMLRVSPEKVLGWIRRAELRAVNVSDSFLRPRYRISQEDLDAFLRRREVQPPPKRERRRRRPQGGTLDPAVGEALLKKGRAVKEGKNYYEVVDGVTLYYPQ